MKKYAAIIAKSSRLSFMSIDGFSRKTLAARESGVAAGLYKHSDQERYRSFSKSISPNPVSPPQAVV
jgi:hypothetical protein